MQVNVGKLVYVKNDPIQIGLAIAAKYFDVNVCYEINDTYGEGPVFISNNGKKIKDIAHAILESIVPPLKKENIILPLNDDEKKAIVSKTKLCSDFVKSLIKDTDFLESSTKITKLKDTIADQKSKFGEYNTFLKNFNNHFEQNTYIVGQKISIADIFAFVSVYHIYLGVLEHKYVAVAYPHLTRWFDLILHQKEVSQVIGDKFKYCTSSSWKEFQSYCESKTNASAAEPIIDVEYMFSLLDWKTIYNSKSAEESIKWFWDNYYPEEFVAYKVEYKYREDLKTPLNAKNLILGVYQRIEPASKTSFGVLLVLGKTGDVHIRGYILFRGEEIHPAVLSAPDFDSFSFTPVDITKPEIKADYNEYLAWGDLVEGLPCCDGKVFQ